MSYTTDIYSEGKGYRLQHNTRYLRGERAEADSFTAPGSLANIVKTKTSRFARKEYGETVLRKYYWKLISGHTAILSRQSVGIPILK